MKENKINSECNGMINKHRHGRSSFWMHDPEIIFRELDIKSGECFLDLGCGKGDYSIRVAERVGASGLVYALDKSTVDIKNLHCKAVENGILNLMPVECDVTKELPLESGIVDVCLISTVLHALKNFDNSDGVLTEVKRILKPGGRLYIIECKKEEMDFGPPIQMRLSPEEIEKMARLSSLKKKKYVDLGVNYMLKFSSE